MEFKLKQIGVVEQTEEQFAVKIGKDYVQALDGLEGFNWLDIIWWADKFDSDDFRQILEADKPYKNGPDKLGIFATRSPIRPNPVAVTPVFVSSIDYEKGVIMTPYIDAEPGTPVIDIKPYHGSSDRVEGWQVPEWCRAWPESIEESADFDWSTVFNF